MFVVRLCLLAAVVACDDDGGRPRGGTNSSSAPPDVDVRPYDPEAETPEVPTAHTIREVQQGLVGDGAYVRLDDVVVTAIWPEGVFVADPVGGAWSGIQVYLGIPMDVHTTWADWFDIGDALEVTGVVHEYAEDLVIPNTPTVTRIEADEDGIRFLGEGAAPPPVSVTANDLWVDTYAEAYEGVLVQVEAAEVEDIAIEPGFSVVPGILVDERFAEAGLLYEGDQFAAIVGILHFAWNDFRVVPRDRLDLIGHTSHVIPAFALQRGNLVLTEVMVSPIGCSDERAEYLEFFNATDLAIDLDGVSVQATGGQYSFVGLDLLAPGAIVLGRRDIDTGCDWGNGHFEFSFGLSDAGDKVAIRAVERVIDEIDFREWAVPTGASLQLDPDHWHTGDSDVARFWCAAGPEAGELRGGDYGTPGLRNETRCY